MVEFVRMRRRIDGIVHTVYPGRHIHGLRGTEGARGHDVTERERVVFFDWKHPGERLVSA